MARSFNSSKVLEWQQRMARFKRARCPVTRFCRNEGVSVPSFYQWRKKLQQRQQARSANGATESDNSLKDGRANFAAVQVVGSTWVKVRLPGGTQMDVPAADPGVLQLAIQTLAHVDAQRVAGGEAC